MARYRNVSRKKVMVAGLQRIVTRDGYGTEVSTIMPYNRWVLPQETLELTEREYQHSQGTFQPCGEQGPLHCAPGALLREEGV